MKATSTLQGSNIGEKYAAILIAIYAPTAMAVWRHLLRKKKAIYDVNNDVRNQRGELNVFFNRKILASLGGAYRAYLE